MGRDGRGKEGRTANDCVFCGILLVVMTKTDIDSCSPSPAFTLPLYYTQNSDPGSLSKSTKENPRMGAGEGRNGTLAPGVPRTLLVQNHQLILCKSYTIGPSSTSPTQPGAPEETPVTYSKLTFICSHASIIIPSRL